MRINGYDIVKHCRPYLIAELSANHGGQIERLVHLIGLAIGAGADAVKLQCYNPESISADVVLTDGPWQGRSTRELYREAHTPREWFKTVFDLAKQYGITVFASVFSERDVDFIETFDPPCFKISSFDVVDTKLIAYVARIGKPIFISTGGANMTEIVAADAACGDCPRLFLHCVSEYPTPVDHANLGRIKGLQSHIKPPLVGLSDHSLGHEVAVAATALGVVAIEKHFILKREDGGPDAAFSMEVQEFRAMAAAVKSVHAAVFCQPPASGNTASFYRKSLFYARNVAARQQVSESDFRTMRPNLGIHPALLASVVGQRARRDLAAGSPVALDDFSSEPD